VTDTTIPRIGFISPIWLPRFGGAEQYVHGMAVELIRRGFDVRVFTMTAEKQDHDSGKVAATRLGGFGEFDFFSLFWGRPAKDRRVGNLVGQYGFMDAAAKWVEENEIDVCILDNGLQQVEYLHTRELHSVLRAMGVRRGLLHYDLAPSIEKVLLNNYLHGNLTWYQVGRMLQEQLKAYAETRSGFEAAYMMGSPLVFDPDFVISCSQWSEGFIDPLDRVPKIAIHPLINASHWEHRLPAGGTLTQCNALMINPQDRKGPELMRNLIADADPAWTFRLLKGGWGNSFLKFKPTVLDTRAVKEGRVDFRDYLVDMRQAYQSADVLFFPSLREGYGMTPVEAMYGGTPVVSGNYPAIIEAVGDGAFTLCPYKDDPARWKRAVAEVVSQRSAWSAKALVHASKLAARQDGEITELCRFLTDVARGSR
jgi:glycosyltransferase involved in cell wall biosynthesis